MFKLIGKVIDWNRGLKNVLGPKFKASRERAYSRRLRRLEVPDHKIKDHLKEAEDKGSITQVEKEMHKHVKIEHRKGRIIFRIIEGEDIVEFDAIEEIGNAKKSISKTKVDTEDIEKRLNIMLQSFQKLAEFELGKMSYFMEGGKAWEGAASIAGWDMGTTENVVLGEAWKQRGMIKDLQKGLKGIKSSADDVIAEERAKTPRVDRISRLKEKMEKSLKTAEAGEAKLKESLRLQFYCTLRLLDFLEDELKADDKVVHQYIEEGMDEKDADKMLKEIEGELARIKKEESEEQGKLRLTANEAARQAA